MKIVVDKSDSRGYFDHGWLRTFHTFSFADYYNKNRMHFGALRVLNDDTVAPGMGFDPHPHKNMEVVSIPLKGSLKHGDSIDHMSTITPGDIQVMSAGSGIIHSEYNGSKTEPAEFLQIWIIPQKIDTPAQYNNYDIRPLLHKNKLTVILAPDGSVPASILQDAWFSMGTFHAGKDFEYTLHNKNNGVYIFVIEGKISIAQTILHQRDGMGIWDTDPFVTEVLAPSKLLFIEVPMAL